MDGKGDAVDHARKFHTLDALRGVAALAVVQFHTASFVGTRVVRHGYLAVDFFFMLSGFVLTFAYQGRLDAGWTTGAFLRARFVRLYPLYLLGLGLGFALRVVDLLLGRPSPSAAAMLSLLAAGLLVLPAPVQFAHMSAFAFPFNIPAWSLFFEALVNAGHAVFLRRRGLRFVAAVAVGAGTAFLLWVARAGQWDLGAHRTEVPAGLARVVFGYTTGILLFKVWRTGKMQVRVPPVAAGLALLLLLVGPPAEWGRPVLYDVAATLICFPILLLVSARSEPPAQFTGVFAAFGVASYAIYVLHVPLAAAYFAVLERVLRRGRFETWAGWETAVLMVLIFVAALVVDRVYDGPVRRALRWKLDARRGLSGD